MRRRTRARNQKVSHDRWILSYADFITLLFAFFVVMYAISSVNEGKYKVYAAHLGASFSSTAKALLPIQFGPTPASFVPIEPVNDLTTQGPFTQASNIYIDEDYVEVASELKTSLKGLVEDEKVLFKETDNWIEIELNNRVLFESGSAILIQQADLVLKPIADAVKPYNNPIQVEGFTDNVPIKNELFASNWELSSVRSASVVRRLIELDVARERLSSVGYGDNFPIASNATPTGQAQNRRVVVLIAKQPRRQRLLMQQQERFRNPPIVEQQQRESRPVVAPGQREFESLRDGLDSIEVTATPEQLQQLVPRTNPDGSIIFSSVPGRGAINQENDQESGQNAN